MGRNKRACSAGGCARRSGRRRGGNRSAQALAFDVALAEGVDPHVLVYGGFYQSVARLVNLCIADRELFAPIIMTSAQVWKKLGPLAYPWRERHPSNPRWADLEYLLFHAAYKAPSSARKYSAAFQERIRLSSAFEAWQAEAREALQAGEQL